MMRMGLALNKGKVLLKKSPMEWVYFTGNDAESLNLAMRIVVLSIVIFSLGTDVTLLMLRNCFKVIYSWSNSNFPSNLQQNE